MDRDAAPQFNRAVETSGFLATRCVLAAASDLHDMRFLGFPAVLTTVLASFFGRTVAGTVRTRCSSFFDHQSKPPRTSGGDLFWGMLWLHARPHEGQGQDVASNRSSCAGFEVGNSCLRILNVSRYRGSPAGLEISPQYLTLAHPSETVRKR